MFNIMHHYPVQLTTITDILGIIGVIIVLVTYFLLQANKMAAHDLSYSILNLLGAALVLLSLMFSWNLPSAIVETVWILISIYGIYKSITLKNKGN